LHDQGFEADGMPKSAGLPGQRYSSSAGPLNR
jgi:hypothetical protein